MKINFIKSIYGIHFSNISSKEVTEYINWWVDTLTYTNSLYTINEDFKDFKQISGYLNE